MDDRNRDLHKLLKYTSGKRHQIRIVPMEGINREENVSNPENIGSFDNLHPNGAGYAEMCRRLSWVLTTFDLAYQQGDEISVGANGITICRPDGTFTSWSADLSAASVATAVGSLFRSSYTLWTIPMPAGYAVSGTPNVGGCQASVLGVWPCVHGIPGAVQTYLLSATTQASAVTFRVRADGFWNKS